MKAKQLESVLSNIANLANLATTKEQAIELLQTKYLQLEYASCYGGWRLVNVHVLSGGHSGAFGGNATESRLKASAMYEKLNGIYQGLKLSKTI